MERCKDILLLCDRESLPGEMLGELPDVVWTGGMDLPRLVLVDCMRENALGSAVGYLRHRVPVVLWNPDEMHLDDLRFCGRTAARNKVPAVLLGSYRWLSGVAAVKELASGGCLGENLRLEASFPERGELGCLRAGDCVRWLLDGSCEWGVARDERIHLRLNGDAGWIALDASLDGRSAECTVCICGRTRRREIPFGDPGRVELGVLRACLPAEGKVKELPLLMSVKR